MLQFQYDVAPSDVQAWWLAQSRRTRAGRLNYWLTVAMFGSGGAWVSTLIAAQFVPLSPWTRVMAAAVGIAAGWTLAVLTWRAWYRAMAAEYSSTGKGESQFGTHTLQIGPEGISEAGPSGHHSHTWAAFESLFETPDHVFLAVGGGFAYVVPKRALSAEAVGELRNAVLSREPA